MGEQEENWKQWDGSMGDVIKGCYGGSLNSFKVNFEKEPNGSFLLKVEQKALLFICMNTSMWECVGVLRSDWLLTKFCVVNPTKLY